MQRKFKDSKISLKKANLKSNHDEPVVKPAFNGYTLYPDYRWISGTTLFGTNKTFSDFPIFCDHYHTHSFFYDKVTRSSEDDTFFDFQVRVSTMTGFTGACDYHDWTTMTYYLEPDTDMKVQGD
jgi:hypothetical protein